MNALTERAARAENLLTILADHAMQQGNAVALDTGKQELTYAELFARVEQLSAALSAKGVSALAIDLPNCIDWIVADLAGVMAGVSVIPVPAFFTPAQREHLFSQAGADAVIGTGPGLHLAGLEFATFDRRASQGTVMPNTKVTFTSGSTGNPKGVVLSHDAIFDVAMSIVQGMQLVDVRSHLCVLPLATLLENVAGVYAPLIKGIRIQLPEEAESGLQGSSGLDPNQFAACLQSRQPDSLILVPQLLMALTTLTQLGMVSLENLRMVAVGGGHVSTPLLEAARAAGIPVYEGYGLSEAGSVVTLNLPGAEKAGSAGRALPHAGIRVSPEGELEVSGTLMLGYAGEETFNETWLPTGDLAEIDEDGFVFIRGRLKNQFITAYGRNVNPEWVEAMLMQQPQVAHALFTGEGEATNVALIWQRFDTDEQTRQDIIDRTNAALPDYAQVHHWYWMEQPLAPALQTGNGRLKRQAMLEAFQVQIDQHYRDIHEGGDKE